MGGVAVSNAEPEKKGFQFPSTMTVLIIVTLLVWLAAFVIPSGTYERSDAGVPEPGSYREIDSPQDFGERVGDFFLAPVNGLYGLQDPGDRHGRPVRRREPLRRRRRVHVRARDRRLHDDGARDRRPRRRHRKARLRGSGAPVARDRRRDGAVLAARHDDGLGGRDARLLRPPDPVVARPGLRPHGGGGNDHRQRNGRRDGLDREPVLDRRGQRVRRRRGSATASRCAGSAGSS